MSRLVVWLRVCLLIAACAAAPAAAVSFDVRDRLCAAVTPSDVAPAAVASLAYDCKSAPEGYQDRWLWLKVADPVALRHLPADWHLLVDQSRFAEIRAVVATADGRVRTAGGGPGTLGGNWAPGGHLRFDFATGGARVTAIVIGFDRLDHLPIMRKVRLISHDALDRQTDGWLMLMGVFAGALGSSLLYNLALYSGLGARLRRFYAFWALSTLLYGLFWSNLAFYRFPGLAGPWGVRVNMWLVSVTVALGLGFFVAFLERSALPEGYRRAINALALASLAVGIAASVDQFGYAGVTDTLWSVTLLAGLLAVAGGIVVALRRGSRAARFYLLAWALPIAVVLLRIARNLGVMAQSDLIDYATFGSMAVQAVLLSIGIGDRFRTMQVERDLASSERDSAAAERESMRRLAETDTLTGVPNRRGFMQQAQAMIGRHGALALIDLDHFKAINDSFGHDIGDAVLIRIGRALDDVAGDGGLTGRLGGEEFALIGPPGAAEAARAAVEALDLSDLLGPDRGVTLSAGVATGAALYEQLYVAADRALYRAKQEGRNRVVMAGADMTVRAIRQPAA